MASLIRILTTLLIAVGFTAPTMAQSDLGNWPTQRPIKMIAVFPPGGSVDQVARILAPVLQAELKQNIVVENIGGASGVIGTTAVARAPADGYTFGLVFDLMDRLAQDCPVALAVSLHAPNDELRDELVPLNQKYPLKELIAACDRYLPFAPRDFITFEYCMLDGVNDQDQHAKELIRLLKGLRCKLNLIPFNPFPASGLKRSPAERVKQFAQILQDADLVTTVRKTRGDDIAAACGQLAGDVIDRTRRAERMQALDEQVIQFQGR